MISDYVWPLCGMLRVSDKGHMRWKLNISSLLQSKLRYRELLYLSKMDVVYTSIQIHFWVFLSVLHPNPSCPFNLAIGSNHSNDCRCLPQIEIVEALHSVNRCQPFDTDGASVKSGIQDQARSAICCVYCTADVARRCSRQCSRARDTVFSGTIYLSWSHKEFESYTLLLSVDLRNIMSMSISVHLPVSK